MLVYQRVSSVDHIFPSQMATMAGTSRSFVTDCSASSPMRSWWWLDGGSYKLRAVDMIWIVVVWIEILKNPTSDVHLPPKFGGVANIIANIIEATDFFGGSCRKSPTPAQKTRRSELFSVSFRQSAPCTSKTPPSAARAWQQTSLLLDG